LPVITISRQMCSLGDEIAEGLSSKLGWELITRKSLLSRFPGESATAYDLRMLSESAKYLKNPSREGGTFLEVITKNLLRYVEDHPAVLVGFGSQIIFSGREDALNIRIFAPAETRIARAVKQFRVTPEEAKTMLESAERRQRRFVSTVFGADISEPSLYHFMLNTGNLSADEAVAAVMALNSARESRRLLSREDAPGVTSRLSEAPVFKTKSEAEFARLLDMYRIEWDYEPKTFPIEWDSEGNVTLAFSPDFYLRKFDTYIELTTMNQKYAAQKNKKAKKLRELYPGVNIKVVFKNDFNALAERLHIGREDRDVSL